VLSGHDVFDRDLDQQPWPVHAPRGGSIAPFQRLIVNPFLAVLIFLVLVAIGRWALAYLSRGWIEFGFGVLAFDFLLFQYHCRDCGATGWLLGYRNHACPSVVARYSRGEQPRFRGPGVRVQLVIWLVLFASAAVLGSIVLFAT